jgi:hypothetical protein
MTAIFTTLASQIAPAVLSYVATKLGGRLAQRFGGTLWGKFIVWAIKSRLPKKTDAEDLIDRLGKEGVKLTAAQRAKLSQSDEDLIDHK